MSLPQPENISTADEARWFADEVHVHERSLRSYLQGSFPSVRDVDDVVQESYLRVWRARAGQPIQFARAFLFRIARNVALDLVRRHRSSPVEPVGDLAGLAVLDDKAAVVETISTHEKIALLVDALDALPRRCREIVILCKLEGKSYREVATALGLSEKTVAEHVYRGAQRLGEELGKRGVRAFGP